MMKYGTILKLVALIFFAAFSGSAYTETATPLSLKVLACPQDTALEPLLDPNSETWETVPSQPVKLNRTPPLYEGDPPDDGQRPTASIQLMRLSDSTLLLRCHWTDSSEDIQKGGDLFVDAGQKHIYKKHSAATDEFSDAFCVMLPETRGAQATYPSMMMGDSLSPVDLYYWRAGKGFERMNAHGRSTTGAAQADAAPALQGQATRESDGWSVVMAVPNVTPQTPLCLAIWDGKKEQRDGLKFYSLWYEVE